MHVYSFYVGTYLDMQDFMFPSGVGADRVASQVEVARSCARIRRPKLRAAIFRHEPKASGRRGPTIGDSPKGFRRQGWVLELVVIVTARIFRFGVSAFEFFKHSLGL